jgi:tRNA(Ile)-lysidine synthase
VSGSASDDDLLSIAGAGLPRGGPVGVAVSGGSDSMAALHLLAAAGVPVAAVTVDHGLRPEAAAEARFVARACAALGVAHSVLTWAGPTPTGNLSDQARRARYGLLADWARGRGIGAVVLGHTADDQAETFLMRLAREAGIDGLSGMRAQWSEAGVSFHRPFLGVTRADLRGYLKRRGIGWVEDPTNADMRYDRVKARQALAGLAPLGITAGGLGRVTEHLASVRQAVTVQSAGAAQAIGRVEAGDVVLARPGFLAAPDEVRRRLLVAALWLVAGPGYPPRAGALAGLEAAIRDGRDRTLAGCRILSGTAELRVIREARALGGTEAPTVGLWDGRWRLEGPHRTGLRVRALGAGGLRLCPAWRDTGLPRPTLLVSPAVWDGDRLEAAPLAGKAGQWAAELAKDRRSLASFILSH